jgi:hypothetical protein
MRLRSGGVGRLGWQTWPADLAGRLDRQTWPGRLVNIIKIKDGLKIENQHCIVSFKKQIKNQGSSPWTSRFKRYCHRQCRGTDLLSMYPQIFATNPMSFSRAIYFRLGLKSLKSYITCALELPNMIGVEGFVEPGVTRVPQEMRFSIL